MLLRDLRHVTLNHTGAPQEFGSLSASLLASHEPPLAQRKSARFSSIEFVHTSGTKVSQNFIQPKRDHVWNVSRAKR